MTTSGKSHTGIYWGIFAALLVLTLLTVGVSYLHLGVVAAVLVAMVIAATKGSLVAAYFMHLIGEHKLIFVVLLLTAIFMVFLFALPFLVNMGDYRVEGP